MLSINQVPLISVVDDDASVRRSLERVLKSSGYRSESFESALAFLKNGRKPNCLILDINMPGMTGLELQNELIKGNLDTPIVFITGYGDIPKSVQAIKAGATDFLEKPYKDEDLFEAIQNALRKDQLARDKDSADEELRHKVYLLTTREYEVFTFVITGIPNKAIAMELGTSEKTVKVHRGRLMKKMGAGSIVELVRLADKAGIRPASTKS